MAKTMRNIIITGIVFILIAAGLTAAVVFGGCSQTESDPLSDMRADAINTALDWSGIKASIDSELRAHATEITSAIGLPPELANVFADSVAVEDWTAVPLPDNAVATDHFALTVEQTPIQVTTYEDTSILTLEAYDQEVTFAVPESAQMYVPYLTYLQYLQ